MKSVWPNVLTLPSLSGRKSWLSSAYRHEATLELASGPGSVQERLISAYDGGTKVATVSPRWRTNKLTRSEQFDDAAWGKARVTVNADDIADPDGTVSAEKIVEDTGTGTHILSRSGTFTDGATLVYSAYLKAGERHRVELWIGGGSPSIRARYDLNAVTVTGTSNVGVGVVLDSGIEDVGNGWRRAWLVGNFGAGVTSQGPLILLANDGGGNTYTGDGVSGLYVWGAQWEEADALGDYIKTVAAAITLPDATTTYEVTDHFGVVITSGTSQAGSADTLTLAADAPEFPV